MSTTIIRVYDTRYNEWAQDAKVCLQFDRFLNYGFTEEIRTDSQGYAYIDHKMTGEATIYVNSKKIGSIHVPDSVTVNI